MRQKEMFISTVITLLLVTGCVKPTNEPNRSNGSNNSNNTEATVYDEQPATEVVYQESTPVVYSDTSANNTNTVYTEDATVISTGGVYEQPAPVQTQTTTTPVATGPYDDPYATSEGGASNNGGGYVDPYSSGTDSPSYGGSTNNDNSTYTDNTSYGNNSSYGNNPSYNSTPSYSGGSSIHLQVAALKDYYAAEEFKNTLSLPPQYSAYIKKGAMNKVIIKGFATRAEAKALAARQFPGAFIVAGSPSAGGNSNSSYGGRGSYTPPPAYTPQPSYTPPQSSTGNSNNGIGVQIGAFSSREKARNAAQSASGGRYTAIVKTVNVRGKTLYKAILLGFSSRQEAKSAIASGQFGNAFVVSNIYP